MFNYLKSEFYRIVRLKSIHMAFVCCAAISLLFNGALFYFRNEEGFRYATTKYSFSSIYTSMSVLIYIVFMICSLLIDDDYKNRTVKNSVAAGVKRNTIYFGKFIVELVIGLIFYVLINGLHIILGLSLLKNSGNGYLYIFIRSLIACLPLFMACTAICHCLYYIIDNAINATIVFVVFSTVIPTVFKYAGMKISLLSKLNSWLIPSMLETQWDEAFNITQTWDTTNGFIKCYIVGMIGMLVFSVLGSSLYSRKEIK